MRRRGWQRVLVFGVVCSVLAPCLAAPCWSAEVVTRKDFRTSDEPSECYVIFCSRKSDPRGTGHSLVVWVERDPAGGLPRSQGFGFYPGADRVMLRLFWGTGVLTDEAQKAPSCRRELVTHRLVVRVDRATYDRALAVRDDWLAVPRDYHLVSHNCIHFAYAVARTVFDDPPSPDAGERPPQYIGRLMKLDR